MATQPDMALEDLPDETMTDDELAAILASHAENTVGLHD